MEALIKMGSGAGGGGGGGGGGAAAAAGGGGAAGEPAAEEKKKAQIWSQRDPVLIDITYIHICIYMYMCDLVIIYVNDLLEGSTMCLSETLITTCQVEEEEEEDRMLGVAVCCLQVDEGRDGLRSLRLSHFARKLQRSIILCNFSIILCYVMLCHIMLYLCYIILYYIMLCYVMLCYVMLYYITLCYVMLYHIRLCYIL